MGGPPHAAGNCASVTGGRNGHAEAADGSVKADLSVPKEMGGPGRPGTTTPKHATKTKITCAVSIGPRDGGGFGLAVKMQVEDKSLSQAELAALTKEAHEQICPYSHATRGNVPVTLEVIGK